MKGLLIIALLTTGCVRSDQSPLNEMMAITARGEVACVRDGVLQRENCGRLK